MSDEKVLNEEMSEETAQAEKTAEAVEAEAEAAEATADAEDEAAQETAEEAEEAQAEAGEEAAEGASGVKEISEADLKKKNPFSKFRKEDKEKAALKEKVTDLEDRVRRQMAEFDNYRKRTEKEKGQMFSMGEQNVLEKILPIVDNFERGFDTVTEEDKDDAFVDGMRKIYAQLQKQLEELGVTPIEALGKEFDPNLHNAVMQIQSEEYEPGIVGQELLKGYMYHDNVLRHSMVAVVAEA